MINTPYYISSSKRFQIYPCQISKWISEVKAIDDKEQVNQSHIHRHFAKEIKSTLHTIRQISQNINQKHNHSNNQTDIQNVPSQSKASNH